MSVTRSIPSLDGLRAASIALVVASHATLEARAEHFWRFMAFDGTLGVRFFFVISGFLITTLLLREQAATGRISLRKFYIRRALRLWPVQFAYIAVLLVLSLAGGVQVTACQYLTALTYTKNYACVGLFDAHLWSLSVEEQFYLLWPPLLVWLNRRQLIAAAALLILVAPISRVFDDQAAFYHLAVWLTSNADLLMMGCLLALAWSAWPKRLEALAAIHPAVGRVLAVAGLYIPIVMMEKGFAGPAPRLLGPWLQGACAVYLIGSFVLHRRGWSYAALNSAPLAYIGRASYSIYIWQQLFFASPDTFATVGNPLLRMALKVALSLVVGLLSYHLIETSVVRLRARFRPSVQIDESATAAGAAERPSPPASPPHAATATPP